MTEINLWYAYIAERLKWMCCQWFSWIVTHCKFLGEKKRGINKHFRINLQLQLPLLLASSLSVGFEVSQQAWGKIKRQTFFFYLTKVNFQQSFKPQEELMLGIFLMFSTRSTYSLVALRINFVRSLPAFQNCSSTLMVGKKNNGLFYCKHNRILNQIAVKAKVL